MFMLGPIYKLEPMHCCFETSKDMSVQRLQEPRCLRRDEDHVDLQPRRVGKDVNVHVLWRRIDEQHDFMSWKMAMDSAPDDSKDVAEQLRCHPSIASWNPDKWRHKRT